MSKKMIGSIAMLITIVVWGISFINIKVVMNVLDAMTLGFTRFFIATIILGIAMLITKSDFKLSKYDIPQFMIAGGVGITLYFYFENNGVKYTTASVASIIVASIPVFAFISDAVISKKKITKNSMVCLLFSIVGVLMITGIDIKEIMASGYYKGYLMMMGSVVAWIIYAIVSKPLFARHSQLKIIFFQSIMGTLFFFPFIFFENNKWDLFSGEIVVHIMLLAVFASALGFFLYLKGLDYLGMSTSSLYLNLIPIVTVLTSYFYLGERVTPIQMLGGLVVIAAVYLIENPILLGESKIELKKTVDKGTKV